jgi:cell division protein ZapD
MSQPRTVYEHPLHERIRVILRLEHMFRRINHFHHGHSMWDSRVVIATMLDILEIISRSDLRNDLIKELDRAAGNLRSLLSNPAVDNLRLQTILSDLDLRCNKLRGEKAPGQSLREDEFINSVRQRHAIPGGTCDFDLPAYHYWLERPKEVRHQQIDLWLESLDPLRQGIEMIVKLIRTSAVAIEAVAENGVYQQTLDPQLPFQMIRILMPHDAECYPEVSGNKHRFSIRFLELENNRSRSITRGNIHFHLACCSL